MTANKAEELIERCLTDSRDDGDIEGDDLYLPAHDIVAELVASSEALADLLVNAGEHVLAGVLPGRPEWDPNDKFMQGAYSEWGRTHNVLTGKIRRDGPRFSMKVEKVTVKELDDEGNEVPQLLTFEEQTLLALLGKSHALYREILGDSDEALDHLREWATHMNDLQARVMARAAARAYPEQFRLLGSEESTDDE